MTTITTVTVRDRDRVPGDQALLLILAGAQRGLSDRPEGDDPDLEDLLRDVVEDLPTSLRPAVRPVLEHHRSAIQHVLHEDPDASPLVLLRGVRSADGERCATGAR